MGTKNNPGAYDCYEKADPDEPMFVLLARDPTASMFVRAWAYQSDPLGGGAKYKEAMDCADAMDTWREASAVTGVDPDVEAHSHLTVEAAGHLADQIRWLIDHHYQTRGSDGD